MKFLIQTCLGWAFLLSACTTTKSVTQHKNTPVGTLTYKISTNTTFKHLDASYINAQNQGVLTQDIQEKEILYSGGPVYPAFIGAISCTGHEGFKDDSMIKLEILLDGKIVAIDSIVGLHPTIAISYKVPTPIVP